MKWFLDIVQLINENILLNKKCSLVNVARCLFHFRSDEANDSSQALAFCLATFFRQIGFAGGRNSSLLEVCPSFICKDKKVLKYKLKKVEDSRSYKVKGYDVL